MKNERATAAEQLLAEVLACKLCDAVLPLGPRPVLQWHPSARILIVGQAPGTKVHETGIPFNDPSGDRLRSWLGLTRAQFYDRRHIALVPMAFCYPGRGASGDLPPRPECAAAWRTQLLRPMNRIRMTLVLGEYAQRWHLPEQAHWTLQQRVANWREGFPRLIPMPHPSPRNNLWLRRNPWFENEVVPAVRSQVSEIMAHAE